MGNFHLDVVSNKKISFGCSVKELLLSNELRYRHKIVYLNFGTNHPPYVCGDVSFEGLNVWKNEDVHV